MMRKATHQAGSHRSHEASGQGIAAPGATSSRVHAPHADINVLLVAADPEDARSVGNVLAGERGPSFELHWVTRLPEDLRTLGLGETTVVLLDLLVRDVAGMGALDSLLKAAPHVPVLVFSDVGDEDLARQAVQRGAQDYLPRNHIDAYSLPRALRNAIDRKAADDALFVERERAQVTLDSIGDAVLSTDIAGNVAYLNSVAERMTGWPCEEALGRPFGEVLRILDATTGLPAAPNPMKLAIEKDEPATLVANSVLVRRDGLEVPIEDSAAPIHSRDGSTIGAVMVFRDVGEARALALEMSHRAQHDFLTDLPNPVLLADRIAQAITLAQRNRRQVAVLFVDLDHFKTINDSLGHAAGDKLLQSVALRLKACVRGSDTVSRKGGDEFVVLLSDIAHPDDAARTADKIIAAVAASPRIAGPGHVLTASVGIAVYPSDGEDAQTLLRNADAAMYRAKEAGRNRRCFSSLDAA
jgi:diguanylate cyclase (GGDEF)-like protein/PAS domain S-box-containing protein